MTKQIRRLAPAKEPIVVTGDLVVPPTIMGWERELLLPVVGKLVAEMVAAAEKAEAEKGGSRPRDDAPSPSSRRLPRPWRHVDFPGNSKVL